jgi:hypothetical protein
MRIYVNPNKIKRLKRKEIEEQKRIKINMPKAISYISESGEKIKYITSNN